MKALKIKPSLAFLRFKTSDKIALGKNIINGVTAEAAKLPNMPHTVIQLTAANADLDTKNQAASSGDRVAIATKNFSEKTWKSYFRDVANYVNYIANGDKVLIEACGFTPTSGEAATPLPGEHVSNFVASPVLHHHGAIELSCDGQWKTRSNFLFALAPSNATVMQNGNTIVLSTASGETFYIVPDTHHHVLIENVPSGLQMKAHAVAFNAVGTAPISEAIQVKAL